MIENILNTKLVLKYKKIASDLLKKHEGLRLKMYLDTEGKRTIGYGRNLDDNPLSNSQKEKVLEILINDSRLCSIDNFDEYILKNGICEEAAFYLLEHDISLIASTLNNKITKIWSVLNDCKKAVLIDMAYALGIKGLVGKGAPHYEGGFKKFLINLYRNNSKLAAKEIINSKWHKKLCELRGNRSFKVRTEELSEIIKTGELKDSE